MSYNPISIDDEDVGNDFTSGLQSNIRNNASENNLESNAGNVDYSNRGVNSNNSDDNNNSLDDGSHVLVEPLEGDKHAYHMYKANEKVPHTLRGRNGLSGDAYNKINLLTSKTPLGAAVRKCLQHYYFEYNWQIAFPRLPESPLLYYPEVYNDLLFNPASVEIMEADIDAMSEGILQRIPLTYYPFYAEELHSFRNAAMDVEHNIKMLQEEAVRNGQLERLTWEPEEVNHDLHAEDLELLDTDFDQSLLLQRDLPSLTLLQRPLYTDMGLVPQEQRHAERLARIVPHELRHFAASSASSVLRDLPSSPMSPSNTLGVAAMKYGREHDLHDRASTTTTTNTNTTMDSVLNLHPVVPEHHDTSSGSPLAMHTMSSEADEQHVWQREVQRSFRIAKEIDRQFDLFIRDLTQSKLGLCPSDSVHIALARALWRALQTCYSMKQQRQVWHVLCKFSSSYGEKSHEEDVTHFMNAMSRLALPEWISTWRPLLRRYVSFLAEYINTIITNNNTNTNSNEYNKNNIEKSVAERKKQLRFSDSELDELYSGSFHPDLIAGKLIQRSGNEIGENKAALPIYPVEVMPIYPDKFDHAAARGPTLEMVESGVFDFLAERAEELRHVVLPGALVNSRARDGPHVLVSGTNLLVADNANNLNWEIVPGAAISYHTSRENTFELLLIDDLNTSSYLFQIMQRQDNTSTNNVNSNNSKCDIEKSDAMMTSTTADVQSAVHGEDIDTVQKQNNTVESNNNNSNNKDSLEDEGNKSADKADHKVAAVDDSGSKPSRRSGNVQHLTINTNLDNISLQAQTNVDEEVSATDDASVASCVFSDGASSIDGRYCIYNRIGMRASFVKANTIRAPPATRYVIVFDDEENDDNDDDEGDKNERGGDDSNNNISSNTNYSNLSISDVANGKQDKTSTKHDNDNAMHISTSANNVNISNQTHTLKRERSEDDSDRNDNVTELMNDNSETQEVIQHVSRRARNEERENMEIEE